VHASLRWSRALALAAVATTTGVAAHGYADGLLPSVPVLVAIFAVCAVGVAAALGGPASTLRVVLLTVGGQTFIHAALTVTAGHAGDHPATAPARVAPPVPVDAGSGRRTGSLLDQYTAAQPPADAELVLPAGVRHLVADMTGAHAPMMVVHLLAAALVGLWLAVGERTLWVLVALAAGAAVPRLGLLLVAVLARPALPRIVPVAALRPPSPPRLTALARCVVRRGPPALLAA
jgi:hypothetical protein